jgi:peroxiredoxin
LSAEVVALSSAGNRDDVQKTRKNLGITFPMIPAQVQMLAEAYGVWHGARAIATIVVDKGGVVRFLEDSNSNPNSRPSASSIKGVLREIKG